MQIPPQVMEEYHIADEGKVYLKVFYTRQNSVIFWMICHCYVTTQQSLVNLSNTKGVPTAGQRFHRRDKFFLQKKMDYLEYPQHLVLHLEREEI